MSSANARLPRVLFLLTAVCTSIYFSYYYPLLPKVVASHFDVHGIANGWQTKQGFFEVLAGTTALSAFLIFGIPTMIGIIPDQFINLPNKDYWLAPEQRAASLEFLSGGVCVVWLRGIPRHHSGFRLRHANEFALGKRTKSSAPMVHARRPCGVHSDLDDPTFQPIWPIAAHTGPRGRRGPSHEGTIQGLKL